MQSENDKEILSSPPNQAVDDFLTNALSGYYAILGDEITEMPLGNLFYQAAFEVAECVGIDAAKKWIAWLVSCALSDLSSQITWARGGLKDDEFVSLRDMRARCRKLNERASLDNER